jgi:hypothetical protein
MGFTKLDERILQSSIMAEDPWTFKVWIALLAACKENGIAYVSATYVETICHMKETTVQHALAKLEAPDPNSRSLEDDGRRIRRVDGGYQVINYQLYRERTLRDVEAERKRIYRKGKKDGPGQSRTVQGPSASASASASLPTNKEEEIAVEQIAEMWNGFAEREGLTKITGITKGSTRQRHLRARMREKGFDFTKLLVTISKSPFLLGLAGKEDKEPFLATFDWIICPSNYQKIIEGNYIGKPTRTREACQYVAPTAADQVVEKKLRAEYDERLKAFMKDRGYKTEEEIPIDIETFSEFKKRMAKEEK